MDISTEVKAEALDVALRTDMGNTMTMTKLLLYTDPAEVINTTIEFTIVRNASTEKYRLIQNAGLQTVYLKPFTDSQFVIRVAAVKEYTSKPVTEQNKVQIMPEIRVMGIPDVVRNVATVFETTCYAEVSLNKNTQIIKH